MRHFIALALCLIAAAARADYAFLSAPRVADAQGRFRFQPQSLAVNGGTYRRIPAAALIVRDDAGSEATPIGPGMVDFSVAPDAKSLLVSRCVGAEKNPDIYRLDRATNAMTRLTDTPDVWECQPVTTADGIAFLSNEDRWINPNKGESTALAIYRMDHDGRHRRRIWHAGLGGVFGLFCGPDGRLYFSSGENQGLRLGAASWWAPWSVNPDGSDFQPEFSTVGMNGLVGVVFDWPILTSDRGLFLAWYYNTRTYGTSLYAPFPQATPFGSAKFGPPRWQDNPMLVMDNSNSAPIKRSLFGHMRVGARNATPFVGVGDRQYYEADGTPVGLISYQAPMPGNGVLLTYTGPRKFDDMDTGIYLLPDARVDAVDQGDLVKVVDEPGRHEWWGRSLTPMSAIYGVAKPPAARGVRCSRLPLGSPYALVGSSSMDLPEKAILRGVSTDELVPTPVDPAYVRVVGMMPTTQAPARGIGGAPKSNIEGFIAEGNERMGPLGEPIPLRKWTHADGSVTVSADQPAGTARLLRADGRPDSSWAAIIPANQPWSVQALNDKQEVIRGLHAETWRQAIPGEQRTNCQGCHSHWKADQTPFSETYAANDAYQLAKLTKLQPVVYERDIQPFAPQIPQRPWDSALVNPPIRSFDSATTTLDDDPSFTVEQQRLVRAWQDASMFLAAGTYNATGLPIQPGDKLGPYADTMEPTVAVEFSNEATFVGVCDPQSGVAAVKIEAGGQDVTSQFTFDANQEIYAGPLFGGDVRVTAVDQQGNVTAVDYPRSPGGVYLGRTTDELGDVRSNAPDGKPDHHIQLRGLDASRAIANVDIKAGNDSDATATWKKWSVAAGEESPEHPDGLWWWIEQTPPIADGPTASLDLWFSNVKDFTAYRVYVMYATGERDFIPVAAPPDHSEEIAALEHRRAEVIAEMQGLEGRLAGFAAELAEIEAKLAELRD